jgi:hypothetical protein
MVVVLAGVLAGCSWGGQSGGATRDGNHPALAYKRVPGVYNRTPSDARAILVHAGGVRVTRQTRQWLTRPGAVVMMQAPRAGEWLAPGRVVGLFLSRAKRHP